MQRPERWLPLASRGFVPRRVVVSGAEGFRAAESCCVRAESFRVAESSRVRGGEFPRGGEFSCPGRRVSAWRRVLVLGHGFVSVTRKGSASRTRTLRDHGLLVR